MVLGHFLGVGRGHRAEANTRIGADRETDPVGEQGTAENERPIAQRAAGKREIGVVEAADQVDGVTGVAQAQFLTEAVRVFLPPLLPRRCTAGQARKVPTDLLEAAITHRRDRCQAEGIAQLNLDRCGICEHPKVQIALLVFAIEFCALVNFGHVAARRIEIGGSCSSTEWNRSRTRRRARWHEANSRIGCESRSKESLPFIILTADLAVEHDRKRITGFPKQTRAQTKVGDLVIPSSRDRMLQAGLLLVL